MNRTIHRYRGHNVPEEHGTQFPEDKREERELEKARLEKEKGRK